MQEDINIQELQQAVEFNLTRDGFLVPVVFICSNEGAKILDATEYMQSDQTKDMMVAEVSAFARQQNAYKILIVSEGWMYDLPKGMRQEELNELIQTTQYREKLSRSEVYQIIEITEQSITSIFRKYYKEDAVVVLGELMPTEDIELVRFKPLQDCLQRVN